MTKSPQPKKPDITNPAQNPDFETHVGRVERAMSVATERQRIAGGRWYRNGFRDAMHVAHGVEPGVKMPHPDPEAAAHGIEYRRNKDRSVTPALDLHNRAAVIQEAARRNGMRPKVAQATSWVQEKEAKEAEGFGRNGRGAKIANRNISPAQFG